MKRSIYCILLMIFLLTNICSCDMVSGRNSSNSSNVPIHINRFDKDLYQLIILDTPEWQEQIATNYPEMLKAIGLGIFRMPDTQHPGFFDQLVNYYSEPTLNKLYQDALRVFETIETLEASLSTGFHYLKINFPTMQIPAVYMHISGLHQNVLVDDSLLSISIDKYMGSEYPLYKDYFRDYQLRKMNPDRIVPDYLKAWLLSEYPFTGNDRILLERMIYEGKIIYIIHQALQKALPEILMGYSSSEYQWCKQNEKILWKTIIERQHLFTPDAATTTRYFSEMPSIFISDDAPGNLGVWIGWQIVAKYMNRTKSTVEELMNNTDYQEILTQSRYKP